MCKFGGYDYTILLQLRACEYVKRLELRTTIQCRPFADAQEERIIGQQLWAVNCTNLLSLHTK